MIQQLSGPTTPHDHHQLTSAEVDEVWDSPELQLSAQQLGQKHRLRRWMSRRLKCPYSLYLSGKPVGNAPTEKDIQMMSADLMSRFQPMSDAVSALQLLGKVVDHGNARGILIVCPPPIPVLARRKPSPFGRDMKSINLAPRLSTLLENSLLKGPLTEFKGSDGKLEAQFLLGRLLVSALVHGGMVHTSILERLVELICSGESVMQCAGDRVYVELSLGFRQQQNAEFRRWFPDSLSAVLIMRLPPDIAKLAISSSKNKETDTVRKQLWRCILTFMRNAGAEGAWVPASLSKLVKGVRLDLESRLPIILANYAGRDFVSHSLKPHVWKRLHGLVPPDDISGSAKNRTEINKTKETPTGDMDAIDEIESRWLQKLRGELKPIDRDICTVRIKQLLAQAPDQFRQHQAGELFARFALWVLDARNDRKARFALATVKDYVITAGKRLGGLIGIVQIDQFDQNSWNELYEQVIGEVDSEGMRRKLVRVLREFQRFLETECGMSADEASDVLGVQAGLVPVDANLISETEFLQIRDRYSDSYTKLNAAGLYGQGGQNLGIMIRLILTLAYRCGLRRSEVLMLELTDVLVGYPAELLVRPTAARRLKTTSSTRRIPLEALLTIEEMAELRRWFKTRKSDEAEQPFSRNLFALKEKNQTFIPADTLIKLLHQTMRDVTGDGSLRFHHLRHSFSSTSVLKLMASTLKNKEWAQLVPAGFENHLVDSVEFRNRLYPNDQMTRRDAWIVSIMLGHSGPDVSMEHYTHVLDICLAWHLASPEIAPSERAVVAASEKDRSTAYRRKKSGTLHSWVVHLWRRANPDMPAKKKRTAAPVRNDEEEQQFKTRDALFDFWERIFLNQTRSIPAADLVRGTKLSIDGMNRHLNNARELCDLKLSIDGKIFRHRFLDWIPDKRVPGVTIHIACPKKPRENHDLEIIKSLAPVMHNVMTKHGSLSRDIFQYYAFNARPDFPGILFTDPDQPQDAINFMQWFQLLGLKKTHLRIESYDAVTPRSKSTNKWRTALKPHTSEITKSPPPIGRKDWACPWLGITPVFQDKTGKLTATPAFRFLMVMAYISRNGVIS